MPNAEQSSSTSAEVKFAALVTEQFSWCAKHWDELLIENLRNSFCFLVFGDECHCISCEMICEDQDIFDAWQLIELHGCLYAGEVYMNQL